MAKLLSNATASRLMYLLDKSGVKQIRPPDGPRDLSSGVPVSYMTFAVTDRGGVVDVAAGTLRLHGIANYRVAAVADLPLAGDPCWVYVCHVRDHSATTIKVSSTEPASTTTELNIPLAKLKKNASPSTTYIREETCHEGDINIDAPLM